MLNIELAYSSFDFDVFMNKSGHTKLLTMTYNRLLLIFENSILTDSLHLSSLPTQLFPSYNQLFQAIRDHLQNICTVFKHE